MSAKQTEAQKTTGLGHALGLGLRKVAIGAFRRFNPGDISIRHHYTGERITLHSFKHKGYWYYGKRRESESMALFARLVSPQDTVIEVGGHIGYLSLYFAQLVGQRGHVIVFEPGTNNLPYTRANLRAKPNVRLIETAVADFCGKASFYLEDYTGQNNSLLSDYPRFDENLTNAGMCGQMTKSVVEVDCTTLDEFATKLTMPPPSFIKIDAEGAELAVLRGMQQTLRAENVALMVEVTEQASAVYELLTSAGYKAYSERRTPIRSPEELHENTFWLKGSDSRRQLFMPASRQAPPPARQSAAASVRLRSNHAHMPLTWALAIASYNRPEALRRSVLCAIEQTRQPYEIIIVDSSPSQLSSQQDIQDLVLQSGVNVRLHYLRSAIAQQTIQRNLAIDAASADVLFMIDDDAYMYPACAEKVMSVFEADTGKQIAAVGPAPAANPPVSGGKAPPALGIPLPRRAADRWAYALFGLWYWPHKERYPHFDLPTTPLPIRRARIIHGYRMIVRRDIARTCRFDENLAAGLHEDLDASYRFAQQGALADLELPLIYHDRAPRPAEQPRKGSIQRYAYIAGHVYLARQYFGHSLYVRLHAYFSMWRYLPLDLIYAIRRGNAAQLRGTIEGLNAAWRLAMAPADRIGSIYAAGCRAYREQLIRRS